MTGSNPIAICSVMSRLGFKVVPKGCHGKILTNGSLKRGHVTAMNCGNSVVGLLRGGSIIWESVFATLTVPRFEGLSRAFFFYSCTLEFAFDPIIRVIGICLRPNYPCYRWRTSSGTVKVEIQLKASVHWAFFLATCLAICCNTS